MTVPASAACTLRRMRISPVAGWTATRKPCTLNDTDRGVPSLAASAASSAPSRGEAAPVPLAIGPAGAGPERAAIWPARLRAARSVARPATTVPVEP